MQHLAEYGLHHVGYVVKDREAAILAFSESCQITDIKSVNFKAGKVWLYGKESDPNTTAPYEMRIATLALADHSAVVEIIEPLSPGPHMDFLTQTEGGIHHIGFDVNDDYDYWKSHFQKLGASPLFESETEDNVIGYRRCLYVKDTCGNVIEIKEMPRFR